MKRAQRRHGSRTKFARLLNELFAVNTGYDTKNEMIPLIHKRIHCETTGRRCGDWKLKRRRLLDEASKRVLTRS